MQTRPPGPARTQPPSFRRDRLPMGRRREPAHGDPATLAGVVAPVAPRGRRRAAPFSRYCRSARLTVRTRAPLDRELSDLRVQVVDLRLMLLGELAPSVPGEHLRHGVQRLPLPSPHLVGVKLVSRGDRLYAVALPQRFHRHPALERRRESSSLLGHLGASRSIVGSTFKEPRPPHKIIHEDGFEVSFGEGDVTTQ